MNWFIRSIILVLIVLCSLVVKSAYDSIRPSPIWDTINDEDYFVEGCKKGCKTCFMRKVGELNLSSDTIIERCKSYFVYIIKDSILKTYSEEAFEYAHNKLKKETDDIFLPEGERLLWEYDNFVKRHGRKPSHEEMNSFLGLSIR